MTDAELMQEAREAALHAYAPYSRFRVGAAVRTADGSVFRGANVENAAYPSSVCAETVAIVAAVSQGHRKLVSIATACIDATSLDASYPCGQCRQRMSEFGIDRVLVATSEGDVRVHEMKDLLPHGFALEHRP